MVNGLGVRWLMGQIDSNIAVGMTRLFLYDPATFAI